MWMPDSRTGWRNLGVGVMLWVALPLIMTVCFFIAVFIVITEEVERRWQ